MIFRCVSLILLGFGSFSNAIGGDAGHSEHSLSPEAPILFRVGPLPVSNSMVVMWAVALLLILVAKLATRRMLKVPEGLQNFVEWIVESVLGFLETVVGRDLAVKTFWFFGSAFVFVLSANWFGLLPGVGSIGWGAVDSHGAFRVARPLLRGANADLNLTFAMAAVFFIAWVYWALKSNGVAGVLLHIFGPRGESKGVLKALMVVVFLAVGMLEVISILFRPVSLSFRLYGNVFAGETMLEAMSSLVPSLAWLIPVPFYFMELLVGFAQALVFTLLTSVFTLLICDHGGDAHADGGH